MGASVILNFFTELINRLKSKSPKFFKILQLFAALLTFAGYVPSMLQQWFNVEVPGHIITLFEDIAKYSAGFFAAAFLPTQSTPVAQTTTGDILKTTDEVKMPFTAAAEEKAEAKKDTNLPEALIDDTPLTKK